VAPATTVVVNPMPMSGTVSMFSRDPMQTTCPNCHQQVLTQIQYEMGILVWILAIALCVVGFVLVTQHELIA